MTTRVISGSFALPGTGGTAGAVISAWDEARFSGPPAFDASPPSGSADAGPVKTGVLFGAPGAYQLTVTAATDYWVQVQYGGHSYWIFEPDIIAGAVSYGTIAGTAVEGNLGEFKSNKGQTGGYAALSGVGTVVGSIGAFLNENTAFGSDNSAYAGSGTMWSITTGTANCAVGTAALFGTTTGIQNTGIGAGALRDNATGGGNTGVGVDVGAGKGPGQSTSWAGVTGGANTWIGGFAGPSNTSDPSDTVAVGAVAMVGASAATAVGQGAVANGTGGSIALGATATAAGTAAIGIGAATTSSASGTVAVGYSSTASATNAIAIGLTASASQNYTVAVGYAAVASGVQATAVGEQALAQALAASAFGEQAVASAQASTALGGQSSATFSQATALGFDALAHAANALAIGAGATASGTGSFAIGAGSTASTSNAIAIGVSTSASGVGSVAIGVDNAGTSATTSTNNEIKLGTALHTVNIPGNLTVGGSISGLTWTTVAKSANFTAVRSTVYEVTTGTSTITVTLPTNVNGTEVIIKKVDSGSGHVVVTGTVDETTNPTIVSQWGSLWIVGDGSTWVRPDRHGVAGLVDVVANGGKIPATVLPTLDVIPTAAADVALGTHKITGLTNGSASSDAAAVGQIPALAGAGALPVTGLLSGNGGYSSAGSVAISTLTPTTAVAFTPNATKDTVISWQGVGGTTITVTYGISTGAERTLFSGTSSAAVLYGPRIPAGYKVVITSSGTMPTLTIQTV